MLQKKTLAPKFPKYPYYCYGDFFLKNKMEEGNDQKDPQMKP